MHPVTGLALGRIAIGVGALVKPDLAGRAFRLNTTANPQLPYMTRMFASREIALGALTLAAGGKARTTLTLVGIAVDGADAFAGYDAGATGAVTRSTSKFLVAPAAGAVVAGVLGLVTRRKRA